MLRPYLTLSKLNKFKSTQSTSYEPLFQFGTAKKKDSYNPTWGDKLQIVNKLKSYVIPFIHKDPIITKHLLTAYLYLGLSKICFFGGPMLLKYGINGLQTIALIDPLYMFFGYGICYSASQLFESLRNLEMIRVTSFALTETATESYKHMLSLGPDFFFHESQRSKLFNLYKAQIAIQQNIRTFTQYFLPFFLDVSIGSALLLHHSNSIVMCAFIACYAIYSVFTIKYSDYRRPHIRRQRQSEKKLDFLPSETFANYFNVKYFGNEDYEVKKYHKALAINYENVLRNQASLGTLNTIQRIIFGAGLTFNLIMGAYYVQHGLMTTGDLIMIQTLMMQFLSPLFFLGSAYRTFVDTFVEVKQLYDTMKLPANVLEGNEQIDCQKIEGNIIFDNVSFSYVENSIVLTKLNFSIKSGQFVGIVGKSGIGKSTILNLIFRLYDPNSGEIRIDDKSIQNLKFDFRRSIAFVSQNPYLFNGTVLQNLQYGNPQCRFEEIQQYAKVLGIHKVIMELPQQYQTNVGEKGNIFSGGQKQRISIIRALLRKTKILLLDEPTSSLDSAMQEKVIKLLKADTNCTKIMITHHQSVLKHFDRIIQVKRQEDGTISTNPN